MAATDYRPDLLQLLLSFVWTNSYDNEDWKEIQGTEGKYFISSKGRVLSLCRSSPRILKPYSYNGYRAVKLKDLGEWKNKKIHRLVAQAFLKSDTEKNIIHHIDRNKSNNDVSNLQRVSQAEHSILHSKR